MHNIFVSPDQRFLPIMRIVNDALHNDVVFWTLTQDFCEVIKNVDLKSECIASLIDAPARNDATRMAAAIVSNISKASQRNDIYNVAKNSGATIAVARWLNDNLDMFMYNSVPNIAAIIVSLNKIKPELIIVHNDVDTVMKPICQWGRAHSIPVLHIPHAIYLPNTGRGPVMSDIHDFAMATHVAAGGPFQANWYKERYDLLKLGAQIRITGLPQYDRLANVHPDRERSCKLLSLDTRKPIVVYFPSWSQDTNILGCHNGLEEAFAAFLETTKRLPECQFIFSAHPNDRNEGLIKQRIEQAKATGMPILFCPGHLDVMLSCADVAISYGNSNVLLEAACVRTARLIEIGDPPLVPEVIALGANPDELEAAIRTSLRQPPPSYNSLINKYLVQNGGTATRKISDWILSLLPKAG